MCLPATCPRAAGFLPGKDPPPVTHSFPYGNHVVDIIFTTTYETTVTGDYGSDIAAVRMICNRCGNTVTAFGTGDGSRAYCAIQLRDTCLHGGKRYYVYQAEDGHTHIPDWTAIHLKRVPALIRDNVRDLDYATALFDAIKSLSEPGKGNLNNPLVVVSNWWKAVDRITAEGLVALRATLTKALHDGGHPQTFLEEAMREGERRARTILLAQRWDLAGQLERLDAVRPVPDFTISAAAQKHFYL